MLVGRTRHRAHGAARRPAPQRARRVRRGVRAGRPARSARTTRCSTGATPAIPSCLVRRQRRPPARARPRRPLRLEDAVGRRSLGRRRQPLAQRRPHRRARDGSIRRSSPTTGGGPTAPGCAASSTGSPPTSTTSRGRCGAGSVSSFGHNRAERAEHLLTPRRRRRPADRGGRQGRAPAAVRRARRTRGDPVRARRRAAARRHVGARTPVARRPRSRRGTRGATAPPGTSCSTAQLHAVDVGGHGRFDAARSGHRPRRGRGPRRRRRHRAPGRVRAGRPWAAAGAALATPAAVTTPTGVRTAVYRIELEPAPPPPMELFVTAPPAPIELAAVLAGATAGPDRAARRRHLRRAGTRARRRHRPRPRPGTHRASTGSRASRSCSDATAGSSTARFAVAVNGSRGCRRSWRSSPGCTVCCSAAASTATSRSPTPTAGSRRAPCRASSRAVSTASTVTRCTLDRDELGLRDRHRGRHRSRRRELRHHAGARGDPAHRHDRRRGPRQSRQRPLVGRASDRHRGHRGRCQLVRTHDARRRRRRRHARRGHRERRPRRRQRLHRAARRVRRRRSPATTGSGSASACSPGTPASSATTTTPSSTSPTPQ